MCPSAAVFVRSVPPCRSSARLSGVSRGRSHQQYSIPPGLASRARYADLSRWPRRRLLFHAPAPARALKNPSVLLAAAGRCCSASAVLPLAWRSRAALPPRPPLHRSNRRHQLRSHLLPTHASRRVCWARKRPLPSWLVGVLPAPLRLGGAVATSDGGAHTCKRNGPCYVRFSL